MFDTPNTAATVEEVSSVEMAITGVTDYVRLLGLPHIIAWTPLAIYLIYKIRASEVTTAPRVIMGITLATIAVSLAFDVTDTIRFIAGDRTPLALAMQ